MKQSQDLGKRVPLLWDLYCRLTPCRNHWQRQLRNDFHLAVWDKTLVPHPFTILSHTKANSSRSEGPIAKRGGKTDKSIGYGQRKGKRWHEKRTEKMCLKVKEQAA